MAQAFAHVNGDKRAGRTPQTISLWNPEDKRDPGEAIVYLPKSVWMVGLGNLGQAYMWALSLLPFERPAAFELLLQDFDRVRPENWGTSVLTKEGRYGDLKTRVAEDWALQRGFGVRRLDCKLDENDKWSEGDPTYVLSGLDSLKVRRFLGGRGISHVVDCGLGASAHDYHVIRMNVFDQVRTAAAHFEGVEDDAQGDVVGRVMELPWVKEALKRAPENACGMAALAGASVAAPFVGTLAAALAITQLVRIASNQQPLRSVVLSAKSPEDLVGHSDSTGKAGGGIYSEAVRC